MTVISPLLIEAVRAGCETHECVAPKCFHSIGGCGLHLLHVKAAIAHVLKAEPIRGIAESEAEVIEAAMEAMFWNEARQYGPGEQQYRDALKYLFERCMELANENDGKWNRP